MARVTELWLPLLMFLLPMPTFKEERYHMRYNVHANCKFISLMSPYAPAG